MKQMKKIETNLADCYLLEPDRYGDDRGYFSPIFIQDNLDELGFERVVQVSRSKSAKGVLRGLHYQLDPKCQAKIVEVSKGRAIDVVVDLRYDSPTYCDWTSVLLTPDNNRQLFVPRGFAHGFISLDDDTLFQYFIDNDFTPSLEGGIAYNDPEIGVQWDMMMREYDIDKVNLSDKDIKREKFVRTRKLFKRNK